MPVVTITTHSDPALASTAAPTSSNSSPSSSGSSLSSGTIAAIAVGSLLGCLLLMTLIFHFLNRRHKHEFTRVTNPTDTPSTGSWKKKAFPHHSQKPSVSAEPLISPAPWPQHANASQLPSPIFAPRRSDSLSPAARDSQSSLSDDADLAEISQVVAAGTATPAFLNIPPTRKPEPALSDPSRSDAVSAGAVDRASLNPSPGLFLHRMLQSRARASEAVALSRSASLSQNRLAAMDSLSTLDVDALIAEAERNALHDAEPSRWGVNQRGGEEDGADDDLETIESSYSQFSAALDHSVYFADPVSRQNSIKSLIRKTTSQRRGRPLAAELSPVPEVPDTPRALAIGGSRPVSLDAQVSRGTSSRTSSSVADRPMSLQLLTSVDFGKDSSSFGGSLLSNVRGGSNSSGRASCYPSIAFSSVGQNSVSCSRSGEEMDWRNPPSGLAALTLPPMQSLPNPHSPVEQPTSAPSQTEVSDLPSHATNESPAPDKRARLRNGMRVSATPEVEKRSMMQSGIASIDVSL